MRNIGPNDDVYDALLTQNFKNTFVSKTLLQILMKECSDNFILFIDGVDEASSQESFRNIIEGLGSLVKTVIWTRYWRENDIYCDLIFELTGLLKNI